MSEKEISFLKYSIVSKHLKPKDKIDCYCGSTITREYYKTHLKTKKHKRLHTLRMKLYNDNVKKHEDNEYLKNLTLNIN